MTAFEWDIRVRIDDGVAISIGRTVVVGADTASDDECRRAFAVALPQFMARAVAGRYAQALADRATAHANDLASAVVTTFPPAYDPTVYVAVPTEPTDPPGPGDEFRIGPAADPSTRIWPTVEAALTGSGDLAVEAFGEEPSSD